MITIIPQKNWNYNFGLRHEVNIHQIASNNADKIFQIEDLRIYMRMIISKVPTENGSKNWSNLQKTKIFGRRRNLIMSTRMPLNPKNTRYRYKLKQSLLYLTRFLLFCQECEWGFQVILKSISSYFLIN